MKAGLFDKVRLRTFPQHTRLWLPLLRSRPGGVHRACVVRSPKSDGAIVDFRLPIVDLRAPLVSTKVGDTAFLQHRVVVADALCLLQRSGRVQVTTELSFPT